MIEADKIARAETLLKVVAGMDSQAGFEHWGVDRQSYENFHQEMMSLWIRRCQQMGVPVNNRMVPTINTLMVHHFLTGVVAGKLDAGVHID
jgi:hypothetical protein